MVTIKIVSNKTSDDHAENGNGTKRDIISRGMSRKDQQCHENGIIKSHIKFAQDRYQIFHRSLLSFFGIAEEKIFIFASKTADKRYSSSVG